MYETDAYTDPTDLVNKLAAFIEANGWTRDDLSNEGSGRRYHAHRGTQYLNMRGFVNESAPSGAVIMDGGGTNIYGVSFNIGTGYSGASPWYSQAGIPLNSGGGPRSVGIQGLSAAGTYHFFAHNSGDQIMAVVEYASGYYDRFYFGLINEYGSITGGDYFGASRTGIQSAATSAQPVFGFFRAGHAGGEGSVSMTSPYALLKVDVDAESGWHWNPQANYGGSRRTLRDFYNVYAFSAANAIQPNTTNSLNVLFPVVAYVNRSTTDAAGTSASPVGEIPKVFYVSLANLVPGQQITLGGTDYRVFPFWKKNSTKALPTTGVGTGHSGWYGFAVEE
jgi:hypothetical protein